MADQLQLRKAFTPESEAVVELFQLTEDDLADVPVLMEEFLSSANPPLSAVQRDIFNRLVSATNDRVFMAYDKLKENLSRNDVIGLIVAVERDPSIEALQKSWVNSTQKLPHILAFLARCEVMVTDEPNRLTEALKYVRRFNNALEQVTVGVPRVYQPMVGFVRDAFTISNPSWPVLKPVREDLAELDKQLRAMTKARDRYFIYRTSERLELFLEEALAWRELALKANLSSSAKAFVHSSELTLARIEAASLVESTWS